MSSASRVRVHSVTTGVPRRSQASASTRRRRRPSRRVPSSGWAMLKVPETAATVTSRLAQASRTRSARAGSISSGMEGRPATDMLNCVSRMPCPTTASKTASSEGREKVLAKIPGRTLDASLGFGQLHRFVSLRRTGHRHHAAHHREAIFGVGPAHGGAFKDRLGEPFYLPPEEVPVSPERSTVRAGILREALDVAGFEIPGVVSLTDYTPMLAVDLEALVPVHAHLHREIQMTDAPIGELDPREPGERPELLDEPRPQAHDLPAQEAGRVE